MIHFEPAALMSFPRDCHSDIPIITLEIGMNFEATCSLEELEKI
jgi:hypothetical protein